MNLYTKAFLCIILLVAVILLACNQKKRHPENKEVQSFMAELKTQLSSEVLQQREEPFSVRSFDPYIGDKWIGNAVAYGCYRMGQAPGLKGPSDDEILEDMQIISKYWNMIRVYGADNDTKRILYIINEHKLPIKVIQGIWLQPEDNMPEKKNDNIEQITLGIELANTYPDIIIAVAVANETQVFWSAHKMVPENLIRYLRIVRNNVSVPVTTADDFLYWDKEESKLIAAEIDFVFTHIHPLWNGKTLEQGINWMDSVYQGLKQLHADRLIVIGETGWATDYNADKTGDGQQGTLIKGQVDIEAQGLYLIELHKWIESNKVITLLFEAFDEPWKGGSEPNEVEKHWGVYNEDRTPKESFVRYLEFLKKEKD